MQHENLDKQARIEVAAETLNILKCGEYTDIYGKTYNIHRDIQESRLETRIYRGDKLDSTAMTPVAGSTFIPRKRGLYTITERNTLQAAQSWVNIAPELRVGLLNFASAKNPGGGFQWGALAQEESIAYRSSLYESLLSCTKSYYEYSRKHINLGLYTDDVIYSPNVVVFRDAVSYELTAPYKVNIITCPAPNRGAALRNGVTNSIIETALNVRIQKVLEVAIRHDLDILILGAFGCGVFKNNPCAVAQAFKRQLFVGGYLNRFHQVDFAIPGGNNLEAFKSILGGRA